MSSHTEAVDLACNYLNAASASGWHMYFDEQTHDHWFAAEGSMARLGRALRDAAADNSQDEAYTRWCEAPTSDKIVEIDRIVLDWGMTPETDLNAAQDTARKDFDWAAYLALRDFREVVKEYIAENAEIAAVG